MAEQEFERRRRRSKGGPPPADSDLGGVGMAQMDSEKIDELLDEIDSVLEENAEEFVKNYVQKGGE